MGKTDTYDGTTRRCASTYFDMSPAWAPNGAMPVGGRLKQDKHEKTGAAMTLETRNPRDEARGSETINPLPGKNDGSEHKQTALHLQVASRRFALSEALAFVVAEHIYTFRGRFA